MKSHKLLRLSTAIPLGVMAFLFLIFVPSAHVSMCMICAIGYSVGLPMERWEETINKIVSFFAGGILFYTVYAGTTPLLIQWFSGYGWEVAPWIYHFFINFALLVLFITKRDRVNYILGGIEAFMIGSPIMILIQRFFGRSLENDVQFMPYYVGIGFTILIFHQILARLAPQFYIKLLPVIRKLIMLSLVVYAILQLVILPIILNSPDKDSFGPREFPGQIRGAKSWYKNH